MLLLRPYVACDVHVIHPLLSLYTKSQLCLPDQIPRRCTANLLKQTPLFEPFCSWASSLFADMGSELGWDPKPDESHNANMLRTAVIPRLVGFGHPAAR